MTKPGSAKSAMSDHSSSSSTIIIPIGKFHHIAGKQQTLRALVLEIMDHLEYGVLKNGVEVRFWEKTKALHRIQVAILEWYKTYEVPTNMIACERIRLSFTVDEMLLDPVRTTRFKWGHSNVYKCNNKWLRTRVGGCNTTARLWFWNGTVCVHVTGEHQAGFEECEHSIRLFVYLLD